MPALTPHPPLVFDESGAPVSTLYGDVFRSRAGAWTEAHAVFVDGCLLRERWSGIAGAHRGTSFTILELGFGLGINFLATLQAWREHRGAMAGLHYVAIEAHPVSAADLRHALGALGAPAADASALVAQWPDPLPGLHRLEFDAGAVALTLCLGDAAALLPKLSLAADAFFLDGFAPPRNPRMWDPALIRSLARLARPGATLATWSSAGAVRDALRAAGFDVERIAGHGGKRHRLRARYAPRWRSFAPPAAPPVWPARSALVVGAGLAGAATAAGFARRGWRVTVIEAATPARGGSAQPLCADHLHLSPDDNLLARLTRAALAWRAREPAIGARAPLGKLMVDADDAEAARRHAMLARLCTPASFARQLARDEASEVAGLALPRGGLWLPRCDALDPAALVHAWLDTPGVELLAGTPVAAMTAGDDGWTARDASGRPIAAAAIAILANAGDAMRLAGMRSLALRRVRGQSTLLAGERVGALRAVLGGDAYAAPLGERILVGASFDDGDALEPSRDVDLGNLRRLARMIGGDPHAWLDGSRSGPVGFRWAAVDRMPAIGGIADEAAALRDADALLRNARLPLPRARGLFGAFAFGSRGLLWATLAAHLLPALAEGEPLPLESDLLRAIDPGRSVRRMLRRRAPA